MKQFSIHDSCFILELVNSPGWLTYIGDRHIKSEEAAIAYIQNGPMKSYQLHGFGLNLVERIVDAQPIGMCGFIKRDYLPHPDIGFAFLPEYSGKGYAFEVVSATLQYGFGTLRQQEILAITVPHNNGSIKLLEKTGMSFQKQIVNEKNEQLLLYRLPRTSFGIKDTP